MQASVVAVWSVLNAMSIFFFFFFYVLYFLIKFVTQWTHKTKLR